MSFIHYCSHAKSSKFRVKRKTSKKKFNKKIKDMDKEISDRLPICEYIISERIKWLNQVLVVISIYYGITDKSDMLNTFVYRIR